MQIAVLLLATPLLHGQGNIVPVCGDDPTCNPNTPPDPPPTNGQIPVDRGQPSNQTGFATPISGPVTAGGATAIQGSASYTYAVPLYSLPGAGGMNMNLALYYNSHIWISDVTGGFMMGFDRNTPAPGFQLNYGFLEWNVSGNGPGGILSTPDGAKHTLSINISNLVPNAPPPNNLFYSCANQVCLYDTDDSSYINVSRPLGTYNGQPCTGPNNCPAKDATVTFKNGTTAIYQSFAVVTNDLYDEMVMRPYRIEDSNGNVITINYLNANDLSISSITDSVGRTYTFVYTAVGGTSCGGGGGAQCAPPSVLSCITDGASCGAPGSKTFTFTYDTAHAINFNFSPNSAQLLTSGNLYTVQSGFQTPVLTKVCRPDATCVKFNYGDWGIVNDLQEVGNDASTVRYELSYDFPGASAGALTANPTYQHQVEKINGQTNTWTYANTPDPNSGLITSSAITDPTGMITTTTFSDNGDWEDGLPTQVQVSDSTGKVWSTRAMVWTSDLSEAQSGITNGGTQTGQNPRPASITTTLDDNLSQSQMTMKYDNSTRPVAAGAPAPFSGSGSITDKVETDFGAGAPGAVLRETVTTYTSLSGHILGLPTDIQVKDGTGKVVSHQTFAYDGAAVQNVSPLPAAGHDNTNYSASSAVSRGNMTSGTVYGDPVGNTGGVTTTNTYDIRGNKISQQAGCCSQTAWSYSSTTDYAYPDSVSQGPAGSQLTMSFLYNVDGTMAKMTDWNGAATTYTYDIDRRVLTTTGPDNVTVTNNYDDLDANPGVSQSTTANSLVRNHIRDFHGHAVADEILSGTSLVSTISYVNDAKGRPVQVSNPYKPGDPQIFTNHVYDLLGRQTQMIPPPLLVPQGQAPYTTSIAGPVTTFADPAGHQSKEYVNALGQIVRVDLPGQSGVQTAATSVVLSGTEQSAASNSASNGATAGTASISLGAVSPCSSSQQDRCVTNLTHNATPASVTVNIGGSNSTNNHTSQFCTGGPPSRLPLNCHTTSTNVADAGNITLSVTVGGVTAGPVSVPYNGSSSQTSLAGALAQGLSGNSIVSVSYGGGTSLTLTTLATGSTTNSSTIATSVATSCVNSYVDNGTSGYTSVSCAGPGWTITPNQNLAGGSDNGFTTYNDTGNVNVSFVVPGVGSIPTVQVAESVPYGKNDTPSTLAQALATKFSSDGGATPYVTASASGGQLNLVTTATGSGTNYVITVSSATNAPQFPAGSTSFSISGPTAFVPGQPGTLFDAGTLTATLNGLDTGSSPTETVNYSQGSTTSALAVSLVAKINADSKWSGVKASVAGGSSTIVVTAAAPGSVANQYSVSIAGTSNFPSSFPTASFASPADSGTLTGGSDGSSSFDPSVVITTTYKNDPLGHTLQITRGQQTQTFVYDGLGRMTSSATPESGGQAVTNTYTDFGAISQTIDPRLVPGTSTHITTTYGYDSLNRVKTITYNDNVTPNVSYTYNSPNAANNTGGRLASVSSGVESKAYQYDVMGRITQCLETIGANQYTVSYAYGADGQITSITYPSQLKVTYGYDSIGRLTQLGTATQNILSINSGDYNAAGMATKISYGNGIIGKFGFNSQLQTSSIQYGAASPATPLLSLTYGYGGPADNGQIVAITDNVTSSRSTSYQYDAQGRLQAAQTVDQQSANTWNLHYEYDMYNNRLEQAGVGGTAAMPASFTPTDPATNHIQGEGVLYDAVGNMVSDGLNNFVFDANKHLTSTSGIPGLGGNPVIFAYGPDGKLVNKNGTYFIYAYGRPIAEYAGGAAATSPSAEYVNLGLQQLAKVASGVTTFNYPDHLSIRVTADSSGNPVGTNGHFPYGENAYHSGASSDFVFTSYRRDSNTGLDYADERFYSSRLGRFASMDPVVGDNRYWYANADPINLTDPTGRDGGMPCSLDPFSNFNLPLCGPDQLGGGVGPNGASCGINFGDDGVSVTFTSNCNSFTVNFQPPPDPFGGIQSTLDDLLKIVFNPDTCPGGTFECPTDGAPLFGLPSCGQWCVSDATAPGDKVHCFFWGSYQCYTWNWGVFFQKLACWAGVDADNMGPIKTGPPEPKDSTDKPDKGTGSGVPRLPGQPGPRNNTPGEINDGIGYVGNLIECIHNVNELHDQQSGGNGPK